MAAAIRVIEYTAEPKIKANVAPLRRGSSGPFVFISETYGRYRLTSDALARRYAHGYPRNFSRLYNKRLSSPG